MPLHLLKLCVGVTSMADLEDHISERLSQCRAAGIAEEQIHTTRVTPKRADELLDGGSLFWVIKGQLACRQRLLALRSITDRDGIERCQIVLEPVVIPVAPRPCRPFQGWRYLTPDESPSDLSSSDGTANLPEALRFALRELCLI